MTLAMDTDSRVSAQSPAQPPAQPLAERYEKLARRHSAELHLANTWAVGGGIARLIRATTDLTANPLWLVDPQNRVVARSKFARGSDFQTPNVELLLADHGPIDVVAETPVFVAPKPAKGISRRFVLLPVVRNGDFYAWLIVAEVAERLTQEDVSILQRAAFYVATEYTMQRRVARTSWNARSDLTRQLVRGSHRDDDLADAADYLGVRADANRVLAYIADRADGEVPDEEAISDRVARLLGAEVLGSRGREGTILLIEALDTEAPVSYVHHVKQVMREVMVQAQQPDAIVGISAVTGPGALQRAYRETREVVLCVDRFARSGERVIAVDDLGPARLFVANSDVGAVRRYVQDVLGALLGDVRGSTDLLRTLQCFFDTGRSVRESAARLNIHENTVRLRLAKIHDLTGLDVAADANDQLSTQTALLVLRLEGHPAIPPFDERHTAAICEQETA